MDKLNPESNRFYLSRKLIGVVTTFLIAASGLVVLTNFSINMIAATGDYMTLISKWNQHHQQSLVLLERYTRSGEETNYHEYVEVTDQMENRAQIINELFKTDSGLIKITLHQSGEYIYLIIENNGKGAAKEVRKITSISSGSTGSAIVGALTQQLSAELNIENTDGIKISSKFNLVPSLKTAPNKKFSPCEPVTCVCCSRS